jgi:hypothetical protein
MTKRVSLTQTETREKKKKKQKGGKQRNIYLVKLEFLEVGSAHARNECIHVLLQLPDGARHIRTTANTKFLRVQVYASARSGQQLRKRLHDDEAISRALYTRFQSQRRLLWRVICLVAPHQLR